MYLRSQFCKAVLEKLGNTAPDPRVIAWLCAWSFTEIRPPYGPTYNLFATEQSYPGDTYWNQAGVRNYPSFDDGVAATATTLENGYYTELVAALKANDFTALSTPAVLKDLSTWCGGCGYGGSFSQMALRKTGYYDGFYGDAPNNPPVIAGPGADKDYTVVRGDNLSEIAYKQFGGSWETLYNYADNKQVIGPNPNLILPGQVLDIP